MELMTKELRERIPKLYSQEKLGSDAIAYIKFFSPASNLTWYATEFDPEEKRFFGLTYGFEAELGYFSLIEFEELNKTNPVGVERDLHWEPRPLKECDDPAGRLTNPCS